jgi:dihydrofolate reductase
MNYNIINLTTKNQNQNSNNINLKLNEDKLNELLNNFCNIKLNNEIVLNYKYFKIIHTFIDKNYILNYIIRIIENVLVKHETFIIHANIEKLTLLEIEKNRDFVQNMSNVLKDKFPDKLDICFIYEGSFIFKQIYNLLSHFIDKKTLKKINFQE